MTVGGEQVPRERRGRSGIVSITDNTAIVHRVVEAFNGDDDDAVVDELFAPRYVDHDPGRAGAPLGPTGVRQSWAALRQALPDLHATILDTVAECAMVAVRGEVSGTHLGDLMGIPPTGRTVRLSLIDFNRIVGGQVVERWAQADILGLLRQLQGEAPADRPTTVGPIKPRRAEPHGNGQALARANKALALRYSQIVLNRRRLDRIGEFVAADSVGRLAGVPGPIVGIEAWRELLAGLLSAVPDYTETVHEVVAEGDLVAARITFGGTHAGELLGRPATGRMFGAGGMAVLRIRGGLIVEQWTEADLVGVLGQLGALPVPT
jgi:predicted ester cyclase